MLRFIKPIVILCLLTISTVASSQESTGPVLTHIDISPRIVDVTHANQTITQTVRVRAEAGMGNGFVEIKAPEGYAHNFNRKVFICKTCSDTPSWTYLPETDEYETKAEFTIDAYAPAGTWGAMIDYLPDAAGVNIQRYSPQQLEDAGFSPYFEVINPREIDTTPPRLEHFELSSHSIDSTTETQLLTVKIVVFEDMWMGNNIVYLRGPGDTYQYRESQTVCDTCEMNWQKIDESLYQLELDFEIPVGAESGLWKVDAQYIYDALGNAARLSPANVAQHGFNAQFLVNAEPTTDVGLIASNKEYFIEYGSAGTVDFQLKAQKNTTLPTDFVLEVNSSSELALNNALTFKNVSHAKSCYGYSSYYRCTVSIPEGRTYVDISTGVSSSQEGIFDLSYQITVANDENLADNYLTVKINTQPQSYLITTEVIGGGGEFTPSELDAPREQPAVFNLTEFDGFELLGISGCGGTYDNGVYTTAPVEAACTISAEFNRLSYIVQFYGFDEQLLNEQVVYHGEAATAPVAPSIEGYTFVSWDTDFSSVTSDLQIAAQYAINQYPVRFIDYNGEVLSQQIINHGSPAVAPESPVREGYSFSGWDSEFSTITAPLDITAQYDINVYTVTFIDFDGTVLSTQQVDYMSAASAPSVLPQNGNEHVGWSHDFDAVVSDMTVQALYQLIDYTVSVQVRGSGLASPLSSIVHWGDVVHIELQPAEGSRIARVSGCNGELIEPFVYRTAEITESCEIFVSFARPRRSSIILKLINEL